MPIKINGLNTGSVTLSASATGGDVTLNLPNANGTVATTSYADTAPGLQYITGQSFTAVSAVNINNCFTSTYDNYRLIIDASNISGTSTVYFRLRLSGTDATTNYAYQYLYANGTSVTALRASSQTEAWFFSSINSARSFGSYDFAAPALARATQVVGNSFYNNSNAELVVWAVTHTTATAYDGITIFPGSGTMTGTIRIYGYRNS